METQSENGFKETIVDDELVAFFDLLARFDFEDKQKEKSALKTDPLVPVQEGQF